MSEWHALTGVYALDGLDPDELAGFEAHLAGCEDCMAEVDSFRETAALIGVSAESAPPPALRGHVLDRISRVRPLPPIVRHRPARELARRWWPALVAVAAATILLVGIQPWRNADQTPAPTATERVLRADDAEQRTLTFPGGASATLIRSAAEHRAVLITEHMPPPPEGKVYELWFDVPGRGMVAAGLMPVKADQTVLLDGDALEATGAGITVEPAGGSEEPTSEPIALFSFADLEPSGA